MSILNKLSERFYYYTDTAKISKTLIKIEYFLHDIATDTILVWYRIGRMKLLNKMDIHSFEVEYFGKLSNYDQHRLTKFSMLQHILKISFKNENCERKDFINYIKEVEKHDQLF